MPPCVIIKIICLYRLLQLVKYLHIHHLQWWSKLTHKEGMYPLVLVGLKRRHLSLREAQSWNWSSRGRTLVFCPSSDHLQMRWSSQRFQISSQRSSLRSNLRDLIISKWLPSCSHHHHWVWLIWGWRCVWTVSPLSSASCFLNWTPLDSHPDPWTNSHLLPTSPCECSSSFLFAVA